jgi:2-isopropylmalate synthase
MAIHVRRDWLPYSTDIRTEELYPSSQLLTNITGVAVQPNKAIVGRNAFAHEAGIHQDGVLKNTITYEIITPDWAPQSIVLKHLATRLPVAMRICKVTA